MKKLEIEAVKENLNDVLSFVVSALEEAGCSQADLFKIKLCTEEIFINVASYAYYPGTGPATIILDVSGGPVVVMLQFIDKGVPFDPLSKPDPVRNRPLREAKKGGMGILITKTYMDEVSYDRKDGQNILTMKKAVVIG